MKTPHCLLSLLLLISLQGFAAAQDANTKWMTDYEKAVAQAKTENKKVLMNFTGSDWCPWCIKMDKEVLDTKDFKDYAGKNLVLVEVDFPNKKYQTEKVKKQNDALKDKYKAEGFPTFVLVDADGKELARQVGYLEGGPSAFIAKLTATPGATLISGKVIQKLKSNGKEPEDGVLVYSPVFGNVTFLVGWPGYAQAVDDDPVSVKGVIVGTFEYQATDGSTKTVHKVKYTMEANAK